MTGLLLGSAAGLVQDSLSSGIIGIGGLAKTLVGFVAGLLGTQFILTAPLSRFVVFVLATLLHAAVFMGLYTLLDSGSSTIRWAAVMSQASATAFSAWSGRSSSSCCPACATGARPGAWCGIDVN